MNNKVTAKEPINSLSGVFSWCKFMYVYESFIKLLFLAIIILGKFTKYLGK